jgi:alpha-beta hydrolase superfamily lysophospholipase
MKRLLAAATFSCAALLSSLGTAHASQDLTLTSADGTHLAATAIHRRGTTQGTVLVHMAGRSRADWSFFMDRLGRSRMSSIALDLRGHGAQAGETAPTPEVYAAMVADVQAAVAWMRAQGITEVSCTGAELGANLCLKAAAADPDIVNLVLLSPGLNVKGHTSADAMDGYGRRPALLVASIEDKYAARTVHYLSERATGQVHVEMLDKAGRGIKMLNREPSLEGILLSWLLGTFDLGDGDIVIPRPAIDANVGTVDTTGSKLPSHID